MTTTKTTTKNGRRAEPVAERQDHGGKTKSLAAASALSILILVVVFDLSSSQRIGHYD